MFEWGTGKLLRTWRGLARRIRKWVYMTGLGVSLPWLGVRLLAGAKPAEALTFSLSVPLVIVGLVTGAMILFGWLFAAFYRKADTGTLRFYKEEGLIELMGGGLTKRLPLERIDHAHVLADPMDPAKGNLKLVIKGGMEIRVSMAMVQARSFLRETKLGPRHRAYSIASATTPIGLMGCLGCLLWGPAMFLSSIFLLPSMQAVELLALAADASGSTPVIWILFFATLITLASFDVLGPLLKLILGQDIRLGTDGIRWGKWPWKKFVAYGDIASIKVSDQISEPFAQLTLFLKTKDGEEHQIYLRGFQSGAAQIVESRLRGVLERSAQVLMPQLAREERSDEEWRLALRRLIEHRGDYRQAAVPRERVREILEDPAAPPEQRLGAAVALVEAEDKEAHRILVSVSEAVADPDLRGSLVKLAKEAEKFVEEEVEVEASAGSA